MVIIFHDDASNTNMKIFLLSPSGIDVGFALQCVVLLILQ